MANKRWFHAAAADELLPGERKVVRVDGQCILLVNLAGEHVAFESVCPHQEAPLDTADIQGEVITCLFHGYQYNIRTGENLYPAAVYPQNRSCRKQFLRPLVVCSVAARTDGIWVALPAGK
ncbi:MAG: Rieske (2Fe-2S) protein [Armatimonadetes bacterium]|nr:Rieske (2Fe-2S) protein [Armatimonadota bacterium]